MKQFMKKRITSIALVVSMVLALFVNMAPISQAYAATAGSLSGLYYNTGTRDEFAKAITEQGLSYYKNENSYDNLKTLSGEALYKSLDKLMDDTMSHYVTYKGDNGLQKYWKYTDAEAGQAGTVLFYSDEDSESFNAHWVKDENVLNENAETENAEAESIVADNA